MWVVIVTNTVAVGPFGTPDDIDGGHRAAQQYADDHTIGTHRPPVLPLTAPETRTEGTVQQNG